MALAFSAVVDDDDASIPGSDLPVEARPIFASRAAGGDIRRADVDQATHVFLPRYTYTLPSAAKNRCAPPHRNHKSAGANQNIINRN